MAGRAQTVVCKSHSLTAWGILAQGTGVDGWSHAEVTVMSLMHTDVRHTWDKTHMLPIHTPSYLGWTNTGMPQTSASTTITCVQNIQPHMILTHHACCSLIGPA